MCKPIPDAINTSPEIKKLFRGRKKTRAGRVKNFYNYAAQPHACFARAYSQYIAHRSQNPALLAGLDSDRKGTFGLADLQWSDESFEPIAIEFDRLFDKKNWSDRR